MVGITLSSEQVRNAPPEVRRWLEHQLLVAFGWQLPNAEPNEPHIAACNVEAAFKIFTAVRDMLPVVNVFFELGHEGARVGSGKVQAFRLIDIMRHAHLTDPQQVVACLNLLNEAFRRVGGDAAALLCGVDDRGYCFIDEETQRSIARVWQEAVSPRNLVLGQDGAKAASADGGAAPSYSLWSAQPQPQQIQAEPTDGVGRTDAPQ